MSGDQTDAWPRPLKFFSSGRLLLLHFHASFAAATPAELLSRSFTSLFYVRKFEIQIRKFSSLFLRSGAAVAAAAANRSAPKRYDKARRGASG
jgi:hypothetical protein